MAIQLPERLSYTLDEVAQRWDVTRDHLIELAAEGLITLGVRLYFGYVFIVTLDTTDPRASARRLKVDALHNAGVDAEKINVTRMDAEIAMIIATGYGIIEQWNLIYALQSGDEPITVKEYFHYCEDEKVYYKATLFKRISHALAGPDGFPIEAPALQDGYWYEFVWPDDAPPPELVIPTSEIHRLEYKREAAKKANAEDVLGTRERETMQAVIAAMTQFIAGTGTKYKRNERPNVDAISGALKDVIPDRTKRGISETISRALKAGLIRT